MPYPKIDSEIAGLLPALTNEERQGLSLKMQGEGCIDSLVSWKDTGILLDGHHRLAICQEHKIKFTIRELPFPTRQMALQWVIDNQLGRRNLTDERRAYYIGKEYLNQINGVPMSVVGHNDPLATLEVAKRLSDGIGKKHHIGEKTVRRNAEFAQAVDQLPPEDKENVLAGKARKSKKKVINAAKPGREVHAQDAKIYMRELDANVGKLTRLIDKIAITYKEKTSPKAEALREKLNDWWIEFKAWHKDLTNG